MGLLKVGKPLMFEDSLEYLNYVRHHGIKQFLNVWKKYKDVSDFELRYGYEIEVGIFEMDHDNKSIKLSLRGEKVMDLLNQKENDSPESLAAIDWSPEYGTWMIEAMSSKPFKDFAEELLRVEDSMLARRRKLLSVLKPNEIAPTVTAFPLFGVNTIGWTRKSSVSESLYVSDDVINTHPRFSTLTKNIRTRRGSKVNIESPIYKDINTDETLLNENNGKVHMDCMGFGMGMCCLQVTFQARDMLESRYMYDILVILAPIFLALTAATPIYKGTLLDTDTRWHMIEAAVDCRTEQERGVKDAKPSKFAQHLSGQGKRQISKSRYGSVSAYLFEGYGDSDCRGADVDFYGDVPCEIDSNIKSELLHAGCDEMLSQHISHLFIRDPLVIFEGNVYVDDSKTTEHFDSIQSTNWQSVRWKPPPLQDCDNDDACIGWRTELRVMEVQLTDFENAAFTIFAVLLTRVLISLELCLYIPLSKVDENMERAKERDATRNLKFHFADHFHPVLVNDTDSQAGCAASNCHELSMNHIVNGCGCEECGCAGNCNKDCPCYSHNDCDKRFPGLLPLVRSYLDHIETEPRTHAKITQYLDFIAARARGDLMTPATWMRKFVYEHPKYKQDSIVSEEIAYDLMIACEEIGCGRRKCPEVVGDFPIFEISKDEPSPFPRRLPGRMDDNGRTQLMNSLLNRLPKSISRENLNVFRSVNSLERVGVKNSPVK